jgi:hypothetical protein
MGDQKPRPQSTIRSPGHLPTVAFLPIFMKLPLTPKMNSHSHAQVEVDLESLLPAVLKIPRDDERHGD